MGFKLNVTLVLLWLCWYYIGCVGISLVMLALDIWLHILVILFYPHVVWSVECLAQESPKKNYTKRKDRTDKRRRRFFYTFLYLLGSTNIPWMREFFLNTLKWLNPPSCQKYVKSFHVCICPHLVFRTSIRVSFLLEVLSKSGKG